MYCNDNGRNISNIHFASLREQVCNVATPWTVVHSALRHDNHVPAVLLNRRNQIWPKSRRKKCESIFVRGFYLFETSVY